MHVERDCFNFIVLADGDVVVMNDGPGAGTNVVMRKSGQEKMRCCDYQS